MNERLKTHSKTQKKSADLVSNKLRIGVFQRYQMKCKSVSKKSPRYKQHETCCNAGTLAMCKMPALVLWNPALPLVLAIFPFIFLLIPSVQQRVVIPS
ncbi:TPA: hypothetical protein ACPWBK_004226 [Escherichia coli]